MFACTDGYFEEKMGMANYSDLIKHVFEVMHVIEIDHEATIQLNKFVYFH